MADLAAAPIAPATKRFVSHLVPFALAGVAAVGIVVDEIARPHDNLHDAFLLALGAVAGVIAALGVARAFTEEEQSARVGSKRVRFDVHVEPSARALGLSGFTGDPARALEGTFELEGDQMHFSGERSGKTFSIDLTREFPR